MTAYPLHAAALPPTHPHASPARFSAFPLSLSLSMSMSLSCAIALACATMAARARADDALPLVEIVGTAPRTNGKLNLDTSNTTGSRLGLTPRETPASVTLVDRAMIEARGAQDTQEILRAIPGITAHNAPGNIGVSYRGFGSGSVSQLFNGINVQYAIAARPVDSWIYDQVDAIGGPSSFLFGSGAVGGSINYITKVAERRDAGQAQVRLGTHGLKEASIGLNRRLGTAAADGAGADHHFRIDLNHRDADSWIDASGARSTQLATSLRSDLGARLSHLLAYEFQQEDVRRPYWGTPLLNPVGSRARIDPATRFKNYNSADGVYAQRVHWLRSVTEWRAAPQVGISNTLYAYDAVRDYRNVESYRFNPDNTAVARSGILLQHHEQRLIGNRLDATYKGELAGRRSDWAFGVDVSVNKQTRFPNSLATSLGNVDPYDVTTERFFDIPGMRPGLRPDRDNKVGTCAVYLENRSAIAPSLNLVTALRHERIELDLVNRREVSAANPASFARSYRPSTGRAGLVWDLAPGASAYAQYATAADPPSGVLSTASFADVRNNSELTTGRQGELGAKLDFWQGKGSATVAAYRIVRKNIATQDPDNSALTVLVGEQSAKGIELVLGLQPNRQWTIQGNLTRVQAQYEQYRQGGVSLAGKTPTNTPRSVANLWLGYALTPALKASVGVRHVGSVYADAANNIAWPAYTLLDLGLSYQLSGEVSLTGRVRNAGDRVHALNLGASMAYLGAARTADLALRVAF
jgi:iron complex outermembrane receptor protein